MINKVDEGVLIDLCEQFNKVILEVLGFYGEFRYRDGESDDYYIISNKIIPTFFSLFIFIKKSPFKLYFIR